MRIPASIVVPLIIVPLAGCQEGLRVNIVPGFHFQPSDRLALVDSSEQAATDHGRKVVDYLTNEFVAMNIQTVERSLVEQVLRERGLDPGSASPSELTAAIASATSSNLVGIHKIQSFVNTPVDEDRPQGTQKFTLAAVFRIIEKDTNRIVISVTANYEGRDRIPDVVLQDYAKDMHEAIKKALLDPKRQNAPPPGSTTPASQ